MSKFRKKPVVVEARQFTNDMTGIESHELCQWCGGYLIATPESIHIEIDTLEGRMRADPNDWIIKGVAGEFYPCKPDIFNTTYELVDEDSKRAPQGDAPRQDDAIVFPRWCGFEWRSPESERCVCRLPVDHEGDHKDGYDRHHVAGGSASSSGSAPEPKGVLMYRWGSNFERSLYFPEITEPIIIKLGDTLELWRNRATANAKTT